MSIQVPRTCPACGTASPSQGHLHGHKKRGELIQISRQLGKRWELVWLKPEQQKDKVA